MENSVELGECFAQRDSKKGFVPRLARNHQPGSFLETGGGKISHSPYANVLLAGAAQHCCTTSLSSMGLSTSVDRKLEKST